MGLGSALRRLFGGSEREPEHPIVIRPELAAARPATSEPCPACGRTMPPGSASDPALVAAVAREIVEHGDAHPDGRGWDARASIAEAHGLTVWDVIDEELRIGERRDRAATPREKRKTIDRDGMTLLDLRHIESTPLKLRGVSHYVSAPGRAQFGGEELVLVREPHNPHDSFAIAVYGSGRKLGHVSANRALSLTPLLDKLPFDGFLVGGNVELREGRIPQLSVLLPRVPLLRAFVNEQRD